MSTVTCFEETAGGYADLKPIDVKIREIDWNAREMSDLEEMQMENKYLKIQVELYQQIMKNQTEHIRLLEAGR